jgi:hypothetical protein
LALLALFAAGERALAQNPSDAGGRPHATTRSPVEVARDWGLLGSWRINCGAPASQNNVTVTYADVGGSLFYQRDNGEAQDSNPVISAIVTPDDQMEYVIDLVAAKQKRRNVIVKADDGSQYRTVNNSNVETGDYSVRDGKFVPQGTVTPWLNHCK